MPEYALTLHFGAPDDEHARKRADDIASLTAAEHGTRNPIVTPAETPPADGDLRELIRESFAPAMRIGLKDAELFDEPGAERIGEWIDWITQTILAVRDDEVERLRGERDEWRDLAKRSLSERERETERADDAGARALKAEEAAAEWQAACEAHQTDGEALMAAIERVRALHTRNANTGDCEHCSERDYPDYAVLWPCPTIATLDAPSGADSTASGRTGANGHTDPTREAGEAQEAAE